ncbi:hypothetical protein C8Q78DRAFT_363398 [Trametes maxima]|nr:hypothetical protein C8Q78DRAFT_363398 [Trametes maxima]
MGAPDLMFPVEIWRQIFQSIYHPSDLAHLACMSRALQHEVEDVLYYAASIGPRADRLHRFSITVCESERRAGYVRVLKMFVGDHRRDEDTYPIGLIRRVLHAVSRVEHLVFQVEGRSLLPSIFEFELVDVYFPALLRFGTNLPLHTSTLRLLDDHPHLQEVQIDNTYNELEWSVPDANPPLHLPSIRTLACRASLLRHLACPTPLTHLYMMDYLLHALPRVSQLFGSTLVDLRLGRPKMQLGHPLQWSLVDVAIAFPRLRSLRMDEYQRHADLQGRGFVWDLGDGTSIPTRTTLGLTLVWVPMWPPESESEWSDYVHSTVVPTARDLLTRWTPYLHRVIFWFEALYERTYSSFTFAPDGEIATAHDSTLTRDRWKGI